MANTTGTSFSVISAITPYSSFAPMITRPHPSSVGCTFLERSWPKNIWPILVHAHTGPTKILAKQDAGLINRLWLGRQIVRHNDEPVKLKRDSPHEMKARNRI